MKINPIIFKSYDVRGIYPSELNEEVAFNIGATFVRYTNTKKVIVGYDARSSCQSLFNALAKGIVSEGGEVYDIGQVPTECLYFAIGFYNFTAGIMITASHNPKDYNGFKMINKKGDKIQVVSGKELFSFIKGKEFYNVGEVDIKKLDIWQDYINHIFSFVDLSEIKPLKVVVDASNGVAGKVISQIKEKLPIEIISLNFEPDGNFPNHSPNPLMPDSVNQIVEKIKAEKADFGFIFDGDADRVFLVDENGFLVKADVSLLLLAKHFLQKNAGAAVAYNAICSKATPEFIQKWGGNPVRTRVGFINVREGLLQNDGIMGGELSGHYCFKNNFYLDSGMIAMLVLLQVISKDGRQVSKIVKELSPYVKSSEINFEVINKEEILNKIKEKYVDGQQDFLDGITVEYKDWWFNVRPSNTEPLLRLTIEANTEELLKQKQEEITDLICK